MSRLINPYQTFRDATGEVLSNGTLEFYVTGTSTAKDYYSDAALTTSGGTSYTLDAYGRVTGNVWLDGDYRVVVKDSAGATVYTIDDVSSISTTTGTGSGSETVQGYIQNKFVNGGARVQSLGGSITVSGSYQESGVAEIFVKAQGTPTNGTADRAKSTECGTSGYVLLVDELTTGGGGTVDYRFRFDSVDSRDLVDGAAIFQCNVLQKSGASKTYTISIYKANAEDDFSGTTLISASSGESVSDSVDTKISHSVNDMGDCSNGIEVVVSCACGAVTTKDFLLADVVFRKGASEVTFEQPPYPQDYNNVFFDRFNQVVDLTQESLPYDLNTLVDNGNYYITLYQSIGGSASFTNGPTPPISISNSSVGGALITVVKSGDEISQTFTYTDASDATLKGYTVIRTSTDGGSSWDSWQSQSEIWAALTGKADKGSASSYEILPGGLIIQYGFLSSGTVTRTFPITFPSAVRAVVLTNYTATATYVAVDSDFSVTTSGFTVAPSSGTPAQYYVAIGN